VEENRRNARIPTRGGGGGGRGGGGGGGGGCGGGGGGGGGGDPGGGGAALCKDSLALTVLRSNIHKKNQKVIIYYTRKTKRGYWGSR